MGPDAVAGDLAHEGSDAGCGEVIDGLKDVAFANAGAVAGRVCGDLLGAESAGCLYPPDAVGGDGVAGRVDEVEGCEDTGRKGGGGQQDDKDPRLERISHRQLVLSGLLRLA